MTTQTIHQSAFSNNDISFDDAVKALSATTHGRDSATACCPAHGDKNPSLSISRGHNGKLLLKCHSRGCDFDEILKCIREILGSPTVRKKSQATTPTAQLKVKKKFQLGDYGEATITCLPDQTMKEFYEYEHADKPGQVAAIKVRLEPKKPDGFKWFSVSNGKLTAGAELTKLLPYRWDIARDRAGRKNAGERYLIFVEGEKDANTVNAAFELPAVSIERLDAVPFVELAASKNFRAYVIADNDEAGLKKANKTCEGLRNAGVKRIYLHVFDGHKNDVSDWRDAGGTKDEFVEILKGLGDWEKPESAAVRQSAFIQVGEGTKDLENKEGLSEEINIVWDEPILFGRIETPDIPLSLLPETLALFGEAVSKSTQTPGGLTALLLLPVIAACVQRRFEISPDGGHYVEPVNIWTVTALPPGSRKTAVINAVTAPLKRWEAKKAEDMASVLRQQEIQKSVNEERIRELKKKAARAEDTAEKNRLIDEILDLSNDDDLRAPRIWTSDVTPERLQGMLAEYAEKMTVLSDEGGIFEVMSGLYSDGKSNIDVFLQAHAGSPARVDRGSREVRLDKPALSFGLTVQPSVISDLSKGSKQRFRGVGALARFLYCVPKSNIGERDVARSISIPAEILRAYEATIDGLLLGYEKSGMTLLGLTEEARRKWLQFSQYIESKQGEGRELEPIQDWTSKLPGAALRIAALCAIAEDGLTCRSVGQATMIKALDLCELLIKHAQAAFDLMSDEASIADAKFALKWILQQRSGTFRQNDLHREGRFNKSKVERLTKALEILTERHLISSRVVLQTRKPTYIYFVNPALLEGR